MKKNSETLPLVIVVEHITIVVCSRAIASKLIKTLADSQQFHIFNKLQLAYAFILVNEMIDSDFNLYLRDER